MKLLVLVFEISFSVFSIILRVVYRVLVYWCGLYSMFVFLVVVVVRQIFFGSFWLAASRHCIQLGSFVEVHGYLSFGGFIWDIRLKAVFG